MGTWIHNKKTQKKWFVADEEHAKKWLKEEHFERAEQPASAGEGSTSDAKEDEKPDSEGEKTVKELQAEAKELGIPNYTKMDKKQLEKAIGEADGAE